MTLRISAPIRNTSAGTWECQEPRPEDGEVLPGQKIGEPVASGLAGDAKHCQALCILWYLLMIIMWSSCDHTTWYMIIFFSTKQGILMNKSTTVSRKLMTGTDMDEIQMCKFAKHTDPADCSASCLDLLASTTQHEPLSATHGPRQNLSVDSPAKMWEFAHPVCWPWRHLRCYGVLGDDLHQRQQTSDSRGHVCHGVVPVQGSQVTPAGS